MPNIAEGRERKGRRDITTSSTSTRCAKEGIKGSDEEILISTGLMKYIKYSFQIYKRHPSYKRAYSVVLP